METIRLFLWLAALGALVIVGDRILGNVRSQVTRIA